MTETAEATYDLLQSIEQARLDGRYAEALERLRQLPPDLREEFQVRAREAELYGELGDHHRQIALYDQLTEQLPEFASLWAAKANALKIVGRRDDCIAAARRALSLRPTFGQAWWILAELKTYRFSDEDVAAMESALAAASDVPDRVHLHFALGKAFADRGEPATAFEHLAAGNAIRAAGIAKGGTSRSSRVDKLIELFSGEFFATRDGGGFATDAPIFVLGLPRSGSTLVEQILGSHPSIEATAELNLIPKLLAEVTRDPAFEGASQLAKIAALDADQRAELGRAYIDRANDFRRTDRPRFIDKQPNNWLHIGFIQLILPNATIIDARRHPMATGFSNFRQHFGQGVAWSYSLETIGEFYRDYLRLMRHFDRVLPGRVHHVINERLIEDFEPQVRALLDHVGVPFDPACLEFHRSDRPVRTASAEQVRRPVNREGVDQWRAFEPWLGPLKTALGPALEDWQQ